MIYVIVRWVNGINTTREYNSHEDAEARKYAETIKEHPRVSVVKVIRGKVIAVWDKYADTPQVS